MKNRNITIKQLILFFEMLENEILDYNKICNWKFEIKALNAFYEKVKQLKQLIDYLIIYTLENKKLTYYYKTKLKNKVKNISLKIDYKTKMYLQLLIDINNYNLDIAKNKFLSFALFDTKNFLGKNDKNNKLLLTDTQKLEFKNYLSIFDNLKLEIEGIENLKYKIERLQKHL